MKTVKAEVILDFWKRAVLCYDEHCNCLKRKHVLAMKIALVADTALNHHSLTHSLARSLVVSIVDVKSLVVSLNSPRARVLSLTLTV